MTLCALALYFEVILAALATIVVALAASAAVIVAQQLHAFRIWRK